MIEMLAIIASTIGVYFLLLPIVSWCNKVKKEMGENDNYDSSE